MHLARPGNMNVNVGRDVEALTVRTRCGCLHVSMSESLRPTLSAYADMHDGRDSHGPADVIEVVT